MEYASFSVGPETDFYRLSVSGFSGDEGDALAAPVLARHSANGIQFSTPGQDNDNKPIGQCSQERGWWFNRCTMSPLTHYGNARWNAYTTEKIYNVISARMWMKLD